MNAVTEKPEVAVTDRQSRTRGPRRPLRAVLRPLALLALLVGGVLTASWWFTEGRYIESTDNAYVQGDIAVLGPRIEGNVAAILVGDNQPVRAGQPLILLDDRDQRARLDQARAAVAEADAAVQTMQRQIGQQQATIVAAGAASAQAQAELVRASADATRAATLVTTGAGSRQANDLAIADQRKADAALRSAQAQQAVAVQQVMVLQAQLAQARARLDNAAAAARLAENNLAYTVIRAPFAGVVGNRAAQLGQHVQMGAQVIAVAPVADQLYVTANFKETQLRRMRVGMPARLTPDIDSAAGLDAHVDSLAPATGALFSLLPPENATGNFTKVVQRVPVKLAIDPGQAARAGWLRAGLSVTADVDTRGPGAVRRGFFGAAIDGLRRLLS